jgi:hypothetical protein
MAAVLIPPPRVPISDGSGQITQAWYQFLRQTFQQTADSPAAGLEGTQFERWDAAYSWGNHATAGYLTTIPPEADPVFQASPAAGITSGNITNWTAAYTWGNHAMAGYLVAAKAAATPNASASAVAPSAAYVQAEAVQLRNDLNAAITTLNALMAALRTAGIMTP